MAAGTSMDLYAAASRYTVDAFAQNVQRPNDSWQSTAWRFYDQNPEVRFSATWVGNTMARARLFAGKRLPDGTVDQLPPEHPASVLVAEMAGGPTGQASLLAQYGPQLVVAGEGWTVIDRGKWHVISTQEARRGAGDLEVVLDGVKRTVPMAPEDPRNTDPDVPTAIRVWQPHPARHQDADSPIRSSFVILEELQLLNAAIAAIAQSRLTGRGIVFIPQGTQFPNVQGAEQSPDLLQEIIKVAETAYSNPSSAAAGVPIFLEVPPSLIGQIQHMTFESNFDEIAIKLREECVGRFAAGMEFSSGTMNPDTGASHWGLWLESETSIRQAVIPRVAMVCDGYTDQWLVPALQVLGAPDADDCIVWYDESAMRIQTDRSTTALELYDRGEINGDALRRETNFDETDKPTFSEWAQSIVLRLSEHDRTMSAAVLDWLGIHIPNLPAVITPQSDPAGGVEPDGTDAPPPPIVLPVHEDPGPPKSTEGLMAAADGLVARAMERAGQKLKSSRPRAERGDLEQIEASAVHVATGCDEAMIEQHRLLDKAWDRAPQVAVRYGVDPSDLVACLDRYTRQLLCAGVEHEWEQTRAVLAPLLTEPLVVVVVAEAS